MLVTADGLAFGTVGGGRVEAKAIDQARDMLAASRARHTLFVDWNLQTDVKITRGRDAKAFDAVRCPMGLELGTNQPYEIALSIAAQLVQVRDRIGAERRN